MRIAKVVKGEVHITAAAAELLGEVLVQSDPAQRAVMLRFLLAADLIGDPDSTLAGLSEDEIPAWPAPTAPTGGPPGSCFGR